MIGCSSTSFRNRNIDAIAKGDHQYSDVESGSKTDIIYGEVADIFWPYDIVEYTGDAATTDTHNPGRDSDHDGVPDSLDDCPFDPAGYRDTNHDGKCDGKDDNDGDGIPNDEELVYGKDCAISDLNSRDTDRDGIDDNQDPYPRDPFRSFILFHNDLGTITMMASKRNGYFSKPVYIGAKCGCTEDAPQNCPCDPSYRYTTFAISDFNNDGRIDFLAMGKNSKGCVDLWWFYRLGSAKTGDPYKFHQRLVDSCVHNMGFYGAADLNNDYRMDLFSLQVQRYSNGFIKSAVLYSYLNTSKIETAHCAYTTDSTNPINCAFIKKQAVDLTELSHDMWDIKISRDAVDLDGDGFKDIMFYVISSGSNVPVNVYLLKGNGDGTFALIEKPKFVHNSGQCGNSPANSIVFADFNNDGIGDIIMGWDDDGDPGSAWFYPGINTNGKFGFDTKHCFEALDINPAQEHGEDLPGVVNNVRVLDLNFDGSMDLILGWDYKKAFAPPSRTEVYLGKGNGHFEGPKIIWTFPQSNSGIEFATPQRLCRRFPIEK